MEKRRAHYDLAFVVAEVARLGDAAFTRTALLGGAAMGLDADDMVAVVCGLTARQFHKSMTTYADHRVWQDVYHAPCPGGLVAYVKITARPGAPVVIQFKER